MGMYRNLHRTLLLKRKYTYLAHNIHRLQIRFSVMDKKSLLILNYYRYNNSNYQNCISTLLHLL